MYLNTFLYMFGLDPNDFVNEVVEPYESDTGVIIYNLRQKTDKAACPKCGCIDSVIHNYSWTETKLTLNLEKSTLIRIKKVRFKCRVCGKTFTPPIHGIERYRRIGMLVEKAIGKEFFKQKSFSIIGKDYSISAHQVMNIFDRTFPYVRRKELPSILCIDEIGFKTEDGNYAAIIYDHNKKVVSDVIRNRKLEYLRTYFNQCSFYERNNVSIFISDLYEGYATIKEEFFKKAIHIADMFHVVRLLRYEVSRLRINTYKQYTDEHDVERSFMKNYWNCFESYLDAKLARKPYFCKAEKRTYTIWDMMHRCLSLNAIFWDAYACLQDFYEYWRCKSFDQGIKHIEKVVNQLKRTGDDNLIKVSKTFWKWRNEIANAITIRNEEGKRYSNGPAEGLNNSIKTLIKDANGYRNFERLRKRILIVLNYGKDPLPQ